MRKRVLCMFTLMLTTSVVIAEEVRDTEAMRTWTDTSGRQIRARYAPDLASEQDTGMVVLFSENNKVIKIKPERLAKPVQGYLEDLVSAEEAFGTANDEGVNLASAETMIDGPNPDRVMTVNSQANIFSTPKVSNTDEGVNNRKEESRQTIDSEITQVDENVDPLDVRIVDNSTQKGLYAAFIDTKAGADGTGVGYRSIRAKSSSTKNESRLEFYSLNTTFESNGSNLQVDFNFLSNEYNWLWFLKGKHSVEPYFGLGFNISLSISDEHVSNYKGEDNIYWGSGIGGQSRLGVQYAITQKISIFVDYTYRLTEHFYFSTNIGEPDDPDVDFSSSGFNGSLGIMLEW